MMFKWKLKSVKRKGVGGGYCLENNRGFHSERNIPSSGKPALVLAICLMCYCEFKANRQTCCMTCCMTCLNGLFRALIKQPEHKTLVFELWRAKSSTQEGVKFINQFRFQKSDLTFFYHNFINCRSEFGRKNVVSLTISIISRTLKWGRFGREKWVEKWHAPQTHTRTETKTQLAYAADQ